MLKPLFQVAACELLHGLVMFMLGKASQMPERRQGSSPMYQLYKRTFPVLLCLACDVDQVNRCMYFGGFLVKHSNSASLESQSTHRSIVKAAVSYSLIHCKSFSEYKLRFGGSWSFCIPTTSSRGKCLNL